MNEYDGFKGEKWKEEINVKQFILDIQVMKAFYQNLQKKQRD